MRDVHGSWPISNRFLRASLFSALSLAGSAARRWALRAFIPGLSQPHSRSQRPALMLMNFGRAYLEFDACDKSPHFEVRLSGGQDFQILLLAVGIDRNDASPLLMRPGRQ